MDSSAFLMATLCVAVAVAGAKVSDASSEAKDVRIIESNGCRVWMDREYSFRRFECPRPLSLSTRENREPFVLKVNARIGSNGFWCGLVGLGDEAEAALDCASRRIDSRLPFAVAFQRESWDTEAWDGAVLTESGESYTFRYETDPSGSLDVPPGFHWEQCKTFQFAAVPRPEVVCRK